MTVSLEKPDMRYAVIVQAPQLALRPLERGDWVLMAVCKGKEAVSYRFDQVQKFLPPYDGKCVIYSFPAENIGEVRLAGRYNTVDYPKLEEVMRTSKDLQDVFWNRVGATVNRAEGVMKKPGSASRPPYRGISRKAALVLLTVLGFSLLVPVGMAAAGIAKNVTTRMAVAESVRTAETQPRQ